MAALTTLSDQLRAVRALIADPEHWLDDDSGILAVRRVPIPNGRGSAAVHTVPCQPESEEATAWTLLGAVERFDPGLTFAGPLYQAVRRACPSGHGLSATNDLGHAAVLSCLDTAIAEAEGAAS